MWAELARELACQSSLIACSAEMLARRYEAGYAAVAVWKGQIVSHVAMVPLGCRETAFGAAHSWATLFAANGRMERLPSLDAYESASGWTAPAWRRKGISLALRRLLLAHYVDDGNLAVGGTAGGALPVLARFGWHVLGWSTTPFVSSLIGMPVAGFEDRAALGRPAPVGLTRYEGPSFSADDPAVARSGFAYFIVSDLRLARHLDRELAEICRGDLHCWRLAILDVAGRPDAWHAPAWL